MDPRYAKYLFFNPETYVEVDFDERETVANNAITIEAWFTRTVDCDGQIVSRTYTGTSSTYVVNGINVNKKDKNNISHINGNIRVSRNNGYITTNRGQYDSARFDYYWAHIALTFDGQKVRIYNGRVDYEIEASGSLDKLGGLPLRFGDGGFTGFIAEVRIWSRARSEAEIKDSASKLLTGSEPGLVGYWRLDEETGDVAYDSSRGYDQRGKIHNGIWRARQGSGPFTDSGIYRRGGFGYGSGNKRFLPVQAEHHTVNKRWSMGTPTALRAGQTLTVKVDPRETWVTGAGKRCGANGHIDAPAGEVYYPQYEGQSFVPGGLVGSLDKGENFFPVGSFLHMQVPRKGKLWLCMWDQSRDDNNGTVTAVVNVRDFAPDGKLVERAKAESWDSFQVQAWEHSYGRRRDQRIGFDTGIDVRPGDILRIVVDSDTEWRVGGDSTPCSANGLGFNLDEPDYVQLAGTEYIFVRGALLGTFDNETIFPVGTRLDMTVMHEGTLRLFCATNNTSGSEGSLTAYVRKEAFTPAAPPAVTPGAATGPAPDSLAIAGVQRETAPGNWPSTEYVEIENITSADVSLSGWRLVSWTGKQMYTFGEGVAVAAGSKVKFYTGMPGQAGDGAVGLERGNKLFGGAGELAMLFTPRAQLASVVAAS